MIRRAHGSAEQEHCPNREWIDVSTWGDAAQGQRQLIPGMCGCNQDELPVDLRKLSVKKISYADSHPEPAATSPKPPLGYRYWQLRQKVGDWIAGNTHSNDDSWDY